MLILRIYRNGVRLIYKEIFFFFGYCGVAKTFIFCYLLITNTSITVTNSQAGLKNMVRLGRKR